jgi:hypothetical protein
VVSPLVVRGNGSQGTEIALSRLPCRSHRSDQILTYRSQRPPPPTAPSDFTHQRSRARRRTRRPPFVSRPRVRPARLQCPSAWRFVRLAFCKIACYSFWGYQLSQLIEAWQGRSGVAELVARQEADHTMLKATPQERKHILEYMAGQGPDETVQLAQKVYSERLHTVKHDIWDVHTDRGRWWVITNPTNLYSQEQFPNMDLALTFHIGLCLRIPRSEEHPPTTLALRPLVACWRTLDEASDALRQADEGEDFQAVGMRCREALITLAHVAQDLIPLPEGQERPKRSDVRAWSEVTANTLLPGPTHQERRGLLKSSADAAWKFANWLTHARGAHVSDAGAAIGSTEFTLSLFTTALIRYVRGVPDCCPTCGCNGSLPSEASTPVSRTRSMSAPPATSAGGLARRSSWCRHHPGRTVHLRKVSA